VMREQGHALAEPGWTEQQKAQISAINVELVRALRDADTAFSLGE